MHGETKWEVAGCGGPSDRSDAFVERTAGAHCLNFDVTGFFRDWQREGADGALSFLVVADGAGQRSTHARGEYIGTVVSRENAEAPGAALVLIDENAAGSRGSVPLWSHRCLDEDRTPRPAQFGLVHEGVFYGASYNGHVYKIALASGKLLCDWSVTPNGCYSAPLMVDGALYLLARDKKFYRLEETPAPRSVVLADYSGESGTTRVESLAYDGGTGVFVLGTGSGIHGVDRHGEELWQLPHQNLQWGEPMACDGALYAYDTATRKALKYRLDGDAGPRRIWECAIGSYCAELCKGRDGDGDMLVFVSGWKFGKPGTLTAVFDDGPSAGTPKWGPLALPHTVKHCSIWEGHDLLLLPAQNGYVECRQARSGRFVRRLPLLAASESSSPWSQVTISGTHGLVATHDVSVRENFLYVFDIERGREVWRSAPFDGAVGCMMPVLSEGICVVGTYDTGTWHAFRLGTGAPVTFSRFANARHSGCVPQGLRELEGPRGGGREK